MCCIVGRTCAVVVAECVQAKLRTVVSYLVIEAGTSTNKCCLEAFNMNDFDLKFTPECSRNHHTLPLGALSLGARTEKLLLEMVMG